MADHGARGSKYHTISPMITSPLHYIKRILTLNDAKTPGPGGIAKFQRISSMNENKFLILNALHKKRLTMLNQHHVRHFHWCNHQDSKRFTLNKSPDNLSWSHLLLFFHFDLSIIFFTSGILCIKWRNYLFTKKNKIFKLIRGQVLFSRFHDLIEMIENL